MTHTPDRRARFIVSDFGRTVTLHQPNGRTRTFCIPHTASGEGYIREGDNMGPQVCDGLVHLGSTLMATPETLGQIIRREWATYRRSEAYEFEEEL